MVGGKHYFFERLVYFDLQKLNIFILSSYNIMVQVEIDSRVLSLFVTQEMKLQLSIYSQPQHII